MNDIKYPHTTAGLAKAWDIPRKTILRQAKALGLGIGIGGRGGRRYSDAEKAELIASLRATDDGDAA